MKNEDIVKLESELIEYSGEDKVISSYDMLDLVSADGKNVLKFMSTYPLLDETVGGFEGGELTVVSGLTGNGKSLFCQSLTRKFAHQDIKAVWFSYELTPKQFLRAFFPEKDSFHLPMFYMPQKVKINSLKWFEQRIHEAKLKFDCRVVFIDHLHFLIDMGGRNNMSLEIGSVMRQLKLMAIKYNMCFFLIAHTAKAKPDTELDLDSIRDSSFISQEADNVLMIWRAINEANRAVLKVCKNRKYGTYKKIDLIRTGGFLEEVESRYGINS